MAVTRIQVGLSGGQRRRRPGSRVGPRREPQVAHPIRERDVGDGTVRGKRECRCRWQRPQRIPVVLAARPPASPGDDQVRGHGPGIRGRVIGLQVGVGGERIAAFEGQPVVRVAGDDRAQPDGVVPGIQQRVIDDRDPGDRVEQPCEPRVPGPQLHPDGAASPGLDAQGHVVGGRQREPEDVDVSGVGQATGLVAVHRDGLGPTQVVVRLQLRVGVGATLRGERQRVAAVVPAHPNGVVAGQQVQVRQGGARAVGRRGASQLRGVWLHPRHALDARPRRLDGP